jgi:hypothetical protein
MKIKEYEIEIDDKIIAQEINRLINNGSIAFHDKIYSAHINNSTIE